MTRELTKERWSGPGDQHMHGWRLRIPGGSLWCIPGFGAVFAPNAAGELAEEQDPAAYRCPICGPSFVGVCPHTPAR